METDSLITNNFNYYGVIIGSIYGGLYILLTIIFLILRNKESSQIENDHYLYLNYHPLASVFAIPFKYSLQKIFRLTLLFYHNMCILGLFLAIYLYQGVSSIYTGMGIIVITDGSMYVFFGLIKYFIFNCQKKRYKVRTRKIILILLIFAALVGFGWIAGIILVVANISRNDTYAWITGAFTAIAADLIIFDVLITLLMRYEKDVNILHYLFRLRGIYWDDSYESYYTDYDKIKSNRNSLAYEKKKPIEINIPLD